MLLSDFIVLTAEEKMVILLHDGSLVAQRRTHEGLLYLFQMDQFYAEALCLRDNPDVTEFRCFTGTGPLAPYLEAISLADILK
jgi:hypothetical protein